MPASRGMTVNAALREWLGQALGSSEQKLIHAVEEGFPLSLIARMRAKGLNTQEMEIIIKPRTLKHRRSRKERLSKEESDRLLRTATLLSLAESVLGDKQAALKWLRLPKRRFDGRTPFEMMNTEAGSRLVEQMLVQIDEGMVA